jgi:hypothetical protein
MSAQKHPIRGILAGAAGGLLASWVMNEFMAGPGVKLTRAVQKDAENRKQAHKTREQEASGEPVIDTTMKAADAIVNTLTGGRHLSLEEKQKDGPIVHYAFGALMGGIYGGLAEYAPIVRSGFGTTFGSVLFAGADLIAVPAFKLSAPASEWPASSLATPFAAHVVYGMTTELVRRAVRFVL